MIRPMLRRGTLAALLTLAPFLSVHAALGGSDEEFPPPDKTAGVDLRDPAAMDSAVADLGGPIHGLFNCAGLPGPRSLKSRN